MDNFANLDGKVALVTGAASGIGEACAEILASGGAKVMLSDIDMETCQATTDKLLAKGYQVSCIQQDVVDEQQWQVVVDACIEQLGGLDILVNNAGIYIGGLLLNNTLEQVRKIQEINVDSIFLGMRAAAEVMKPGGKSGRGGSIINLSSVAGLMGLPGHSVYGATKGAVRLYTKHAAVEFATFNYGVRVNSVHPGVIDTPMGGQVFEDFVEIGLAATVEEANLLLEKMIPMSRPGQVEEVASLVRFLASDVSGYCTGAEFVTDGGISAA